MLADDGRSPISARIAVVLPHPDSPTSPRRDPRREREIDAADRVELAAGPQIEPDIEIADAEQEIPSASATGAASPRWVARRCSLLVELPVEWPQPEAANGRWPTRSRRVEHVLEPCPTIVARARGRDGDPGWQHRPPGVVEDRAARQRVLDHLAPGDRRRVPESEERTYVSAKIAVAIIRTVFATSSGPTCGNTWRQDAPDVARAEHLGAPYVDALTDRT